MEKYVVTVGSMWVSNIDGTREETGQITGIKNLSLTSDKSHAMVFDNRNSAKSVANKIKTYGTVIQL